MQYEVNLKINNNGSPVEAHCECPAGSGTNATCKHVGVLLFAVDHMANDKIMLLQEVCTQRLQRFHVLKTRHTGSPLKANRLPRATDRCNIIFETYDIATINVENYNFDVRNLILNFGPTTMPMKQLYEPANPYAIVQDHNYVGIDPEQKVLDDLLLNSISTAQVNSIESATRKQRNCVEWYDRRRVRLTASTFHTICHVRRENRRSYANQLFNKCSFTSRATNHGIINEKVAVGKYCTMYNLSMEDSGLYISQERPYLAASKIRAREQPIGC